MGVGGKGQMGGMPQMMGMMGGKPGAMPAQMMQMPNQQGMRPQQSQSMPQGPQQGGPLTAAALAAAPPGVQKQMLGEKLFPAISKFQPELAGKITGMMLEMDNSELLMLLESDMQLKNKVDEAMKVLDSLKNK